MRFHLAFATVLSLALLGCSGVTGPDAWIPGVEDLDLDGWSGSEDCDDEESGANPGLEEICGDGIDNDCDGSPGDCGLDARIDLSEADGRIVGSAAGEHAGWSVAGVGDVNGDGFDDIAVGSWQDDEGGSYAGAVWIVLGPVVGSLNLSRAAAKLVGEAPDDHAGWSVAGAGDINRDGYADVLVGAYGAADGAGSAYLVLGPMEGTISLADSDAIIRGEEELAAVGFSVAGIGDMDADGYPDLAVGAYGHDTPAADDVGAVYVFRGPLLGVRGTDSADALLVGLGEGDWFGYSVVGAGDVDGDGRDDLLVGAPGVTRDGPDAGAAYLFAGPVSGTRTTAGARAQLLGATANDRAGASVAGGGDLNGDGFADLVVGGWLVDGVAGEDFAGAIDAGAAYVLHGPVSGLVELAGGADATIHGPHARAAAGFSVAIAPDVDGDGLDDIVIGAVKENTGGPDAGAAWVLHGPFEGIVPLAGDVKGTMLVGEVWSDLAGAGVAGVGDTDGDGYGDVVIGAHGSDRGGLDSGASYLICGKGY